MDRNKFFYLGADLRPDPPDDRDYKFSSIPDEKRMIKTSESLPRQIDWSSEMSPVKFQGSMGSCIAFAVCALKEWQEKKEYEKEKAEGKIYDRKEADYNFSEQWVYWNAKKIDPWPGEQGTNYRSALKVVQKIGVPLEDAWPYSDDPINIGQPSRWAHLIARWALIDSYWRVENNVEGLKRALAEGPVLIGIPCHEEIYGNLINGFIPYPAKPNEIYAYHAVLATGYNDEDRTLIFRNSWSPFWGDRGYGRVTYDYINDFMTDAWTVKDISVTKDMLKGARKLVD